MLLSERPYFQNAKEGTYVTQPYIDSATDEMCVSVATPLSDGTATAGLLILDLKLTQVASDGGRQKYVVLRPDEGGMSEKYVRVLQDGYVSMDMAQNILVIKTVSGMAMAVAAAVDAMDWSEVVGCIAGDDTIMCAIRTVEDTAVVMDKIRKIVSKGK